MGSKRSAQPPDLPVGLKGEKVRRDIATLAFEPVNLSLTVTARKAYTVMLYLAQRMTRDDEGGYTAPLASIVRGGGASVKMGDVVMEYLKQMTSTNVLYRPVSETEQYSLLPDQPAADDGPEEERVFALLAEARIFKRGGDNWVTWFYPPTIEQQIINPQRWAVIELDVVAQLTTYTAVALYEIVARYRDSPGQLTPKRKAEFWVPILRGNSTSKDREWRKFKAEFVLPAIAQINDVSDLEIEIIEHKYGGRKVIDVQFSVRRRKRTVQTNAHPVDMEIVTTALQLGLVIGQVEQLIEQYGEDRMKVGLVLLQKRVANSALAPVGKPFKYLAETLSNLPVISRKPSPDSADESQEQKPDEQRKRPAAQANIAELTHEAGERFRRERIERTAGLFSKLDQAEMDRWMDAHAASLDQSPAFTRMIRRLRERDWKSPLILGALMKFYAVNGLGEDWSDPTPDQLAAAIAEGKSASAS